MENKCEACAGEGLVHQGESISKTCESCAGTGKSVSSEVTASEPVVESLPEKEEGVGEGFLEEAGEVSSEPSPAE